MKLQPNTADVVIAGAGIVGLSTALELARAGLKVCVIDRDEAGRQCSWAGGGILAPLPPDVPVPEIESLLHESLQIYPDYCEKLLNSTGIDPEYWVCGAHVSDRAGERWLPHVAQVRNPRLLKALRSALELHGASIVEHTEVLGWNSVSGQLTGVRTSRGDIACVQAVLAAGAWSGELANISISPIKGQMLLLQGKLGVLEHIRMNEHAYLIPRRDGLIVVGSTVEDAGFDVTATTAARDFLKQQATSLWPPVAGLAIKHHWAGLRPRAPTLAPVICPAKDLSGLFYNTGHFRLGITLAPASARRVLAAILRKDKRSIA